MFNYKLVLKGMAMGAADLIPGVSGGTIALIVGIYEELITSIKSLDHMAFRLLVKGKWTEFWGYINGKFLLLLFLGIFISVFTLSSLFSYLLEAHPIAVWSFFFGLILVSAFYVLPSKKYWQTYVFGAIGLVTAYLITSATPAETPNQLWFVFLSGSIAICAMILPGISGSFILILLAKYEFVMQAVKSLDWATLLVFGVGCFTGLISFSKVIHWMLRNFKIQTMAVLGGFMLGSLNKIWPWKLETEESFANVWPGDFTTQTGESHQLALASVCFLIGVIVVAMLEKLGNKSIAF